MSTFNSVRSAVFASAINTYHMRAVVLIVALALFALQAGPNLCSHTNSIADLDGLHLVSDLDGFADNLVADTDRQRTVTPTTVDGVDIGTAHTAALDADIDIVVVKLLGLEL